MIQKSWPKRLIDFDRPNPPLRCRIRRELRNGYCVIPKGKFGHVEAGSSWSRLEFVSEACGECGVKARCSRLSKADIELVDEWGRPLP